MYRNILHNNMQPDQLVFFVCASVCMMFVYVCMCSLNHDRNANSKFETNDYKHETLVGNLK